MHVHRWKLKDNERQSLYDCCNKWTKAIGKHRTFMGGEKPNLADLVLYIWIIIIVLHFYCRLCMVY